jgi:tol-pal system protein YbgF
MSLARITAPRARLSVVWRPLALALTLALAHGAGQAALFGDDEARKAIIDLRAQRTQDTEATNAKLSALSAQIDQLKRSLLDINSQMEQLRAENARLRGTNEVLVRDVTELQRRQKDMQASVDERVRKLEPQQVSLDGKTFKVDADEKREFEEALAKLRATDFAGAVSGLSILLQRYPSTGYRESAQYWLGNAQYGQGDYKAAIDAFKQLVERSPDHVRAPEALLSVANCHGQLKDNDNARKALEQLVKQYPQTEAAQAARDRLLTMPKDEPAKPAKPAGKPTDKAPAKPKR